MAFVPVINLLTDLGDVILKNCYWSAGILRLIRFGASVVWSFGLFEAPCSFGLHPTDQ
jgi:hypothetical protein